jgi:hypothetical protein
VVATPRRPQLRFSGSMHVHRTLCREREALDQKNEREAHQTEKAEEPEVVHERPQPGLLQHAGVNDLVALQRGGHRAGLRRQHGFRRGQRAEESWIVGRRMRHQIGLVPLRAAVEHRRHGMRILTTDTDFDEFAKPLPIDLHAARGRK